DARDTCCEKVLSCGHYCNGVKEEKECLPCLRATCKSNANIELKQDSDDICAVCWTDNLLAQPTLLLECGHAFHYACTRKLLELRWNGPRVTFGFRNCPLCK